MKIKLIFVSLMALMIAVACGTKQEQAKAVANTTLTLSVEGMTCSGCEESVQTALTKLNGVTEATASHTDSTVVVSFDSTLINVAQLGDEINNLDFQYIGIKQ